MPETLKIKVYKTVIRSVMIYACGTWALKAGFHIIAHDRC